MTDPVSVAASLVTLSETVASTVKFVQKFRHAPAEVSNLLQELGQISTELEILYELQRAFTNHDPPANMIDAQRQSIDRAVERVKCIQDVLQQTVDACAGTRGRIRWAFLGKDKVSALLQDLLHSRTALTSVMSISICLLQGSSHSAALQAIEKLTHRVDDALSKPLISRPATSDVFQAPSGAAIVMALAAYTYTNSTQFSTYIPLLGFLAGSLITLAHQERGTTYGISLIAQLPFSRALVADICLKTNLNTWFSVQILRDSSLAVVKLVPQDSAFLQACEAGDTNQMAFMLSCRQATPHEITPGNQTPMFKAIKSGNVDAVQMLLDYGADANGLFGRLQTSPLVVAIRERNVEIVRLLLAYGACCQHVTVLGWTPLFYLWSLSNQAQAAQHSKTLLAILTGRPDFRLSHRGIIDTVGYSAIHMAAIRGTLDEMQILIDNKVDLFCESGPAKWTSIHYAVEAGRLEMFDFLWPYYKHLGIDCRDAQMWTLLHIAAILGHASLIERLLQLGASLGAVTDRYVTFLSDDVEHMREQLIGICWTPGQLAAAHSPRRYEIFMRAVERNVGKHAIELCVCADAAEDSESDDEMWCEALE